MNDNAPTDKPDGEHLTSSKAGPVLFAAVAFGIVLFFMWLL